MAVELEPEQREILAMAQEYSELIQSPGWKRIWKFGENRVRSALTAMKSSVSGDPAVNQRLMLAWKERELFMDAIHTEITNAIEQRKEVMEEVAISLGATQEQIDELIEKEEMYGR